MPALGPELQAQVGKYCSILGHDLPCTHNEGFHCDPGQKPHTNAAQNADKSTALRMKAADDAARGKAARRREMAGRRAPVGQRTPPGRSWSRW